MPSAHRTDLALSSGNVPSDGATDHNRKLNLIAGRLVRADQVAAALDRISPR
jgi:hypothetical protein